ncbi:MAG TPA: hypothetical protein DCY26_15475 [Hyphomonas sp.]|nr:hypothetical protein [Hyphomonas sp.]
MRDEVRRSGFTFVSGEATKSLLTSESIESWDAFAESWNDLGADAYMADGGGYRRRRHAVFQVRRGVLLRCEHQPHFQSRDYNPLNGGVQRWFEPIGVTVGASILLRDLIVACGRLIAELELGQENVHRIEVHQFRIEHHADEEAFPTPEGVHRDGVDWVCVILIKRFNVSGGTTSLADMTGKEIQVLLLADELDMVFLNDRRLAHAVAPIRRRDPRRPGFRDALVITFVAQRRE